MKSSSLCIGRMRKQDLNHPTQEWGHGVEKVENSVPSILILWVEQVNGAFRKPEPYEVEKEQELLGESKAEQHIAAALKVRELALKAGASEGPSQNFQKAKN